MPNSITRSRIEELLELAATRRVAVVGDAMLDVYLHGDVERISPEAPVPVVRVRDRRSALGGAANVAQNARAIGAGCELVCAVGRDPAAALLRKDLVDLGVDISGVLEVSRPTTTKTRVVARSQQMLRLDEEEDTDLRDEDLERLTAAVVAAARTCDALVLEDYNKGVLVPSVISAATEAATERGIPVVVDPKYRNFFAYRGATVFKPNRRELEAALGAAVDMDHPEALPDVFQRLGVQHLLLTLGDQGMALLSSEGVVRIPTTAREVYDVVGAGDTVTAWLAVLLASGADVREAAVVANYAAGIEVGKLGAVSVTGEEVLEAYDDFQQRAAESKAR
jgi:rfaE bifunctional protein kinase chain/domain